jgi:sugar-specific transcriptional regulator TrmB
MKKAVLTASEQTLLDRLGLSKRAIVLYEHLLRQDSLTAKQAAIIMKELPSAEYRLFRQLEQLGLIRRSTARPVVFTAISKEIGLRAAYLRFRFDLEKLVEKAAAGENEYHLEVMIGRQALYQKYIELAGQSRQEICIYAIGIAYSKELERSQQLALKRGVRIRHILQQIKPSNFHVTHKWQRLGVQLRYAQSERGFHFMLFDAEVALISFSDPENTDDRLSIVTNNPAAVRLFETDFQHIWSNAREVSV